MAQTPQQYKVANNEVWNYNREEFLFVAIILTDGCEYYFSKSPNRKLPEDADLALRNSHSPGLLSAASSSWSFDSCFPMTRTVKAHS